MYEIILLIALVWTIFGFYWMLQMLKLTKQSRIINSMMLKAFLKYAENKGVNIDIQKIQKEVEDNV